MCEASLVPPKQSVLSIFVGFCYATQLTITHCNFIETRPRAAKGAAALDLTKQMPQMLPYIERLQRILTAVSGQHPLDYTPPPPGPPPLPYPSVTQGWLAWHPVQMVCHTGRLLATQHGTSGQA